MARIDHVAFESSEPERAAQFYEEFLGARIVRAESHPVMAYLQLGAIALHEPDGPGPHVAFRVSEEERATLRHALEAAGIPHRERDHEIALGLFFSDPDGRQLEAITYRSGDDPR